MQSREQDVKVPERASVRVVDPIFRLGELAVDTGIADLAGTPIITCCPRGESGELQLLRRGQQFGDAGEQPAGSAAVQHPVIETQR
jgi:hypothetical protein